MRRGVIMEHHLEFGTGSATERPQPRVAARV
jgi:hypothetical protein